MIHLYINAKKTRGSKAQHIGKIFPSDEESESSSTISDTSDEELEEQPSRAAQREHSKYQKERLKRTIFVGNLPASITSRDLHKLFRKSLKSEGVDAQVCKIESVRLRGAVPLTGGTSKQARKRSSIQHEFAAGENHTVIGYVVLTSREGIPAILKLNSHLIDGRHIRVDVCGATKPSYNTQKSIFIGNLPFSVNEEQVRQTFASFGEIKSVRLIRDSTTGAVKGIGFVEFAEPTSVTLVIRRAASSSGDDANVGLSIGGRPLRVQAWKSIKKAKAADVPKKRNNRIESRSPMATEKSSRVAVRVPTNVRGMDRVKFVKRALKRRDKRKFRTATNKTTKK